MFWAVTSARGSRALAGHFPPPHDKGFRFREGSASGGPPFGTRDGTPGRRSRPPGMASRAPDAILRRPRTAAARKAPWRRAAPRPYGRPAWEATPRKAHPEPIVPDPTPIEPSDPGPTLRFDAPHPVAAAQAWGRWRQRRARMTQAAQPAPTSPTEEGHGAQVRRRIPRRSARRRSWRPAGSPGAGLRRLRAP